MPKVLIIHFNTIDLLTNEAQKYIFFDNEHQCHYGKFVFLFTVIMINHHAHFHIGQEGLQLGDELVAECFFVVD